MSESRLVLVLEPSNADALTLETAFREHKVCNPARVLRNEYELRSYLNGAGVYSNRELFPVPALMLLNFSIPTTALHVMEWLNQCGQLTQFPVIGVGNQIPTETLQLAFDLGLSGYFEKPAEVRRLAKMICELQWTDEWKYQLSDSAQIQLLTKEQFYRMGAA